MPPGWDTWRTLLAGGQSTYCMYGYTLSMDGHYARTYGTADADYQTDVLAQMGVDFLRVHDSRPFFLTMTPVAPHYEDCAGGGEDTGTSIRPPRRYLDTPADPLPAESLPSFNEKDMSDKPRWMRTLPFLDPSVEKTGYDSKVAAIRAVDDMVGDLALALEQTGQYDRTMIVLTSDNGFQYATHRRDGKINLYEESIRLPMVIHAATQRSARSTSEWVMNNDWAPTIADAAGVTPGLTEDGKSLMPLVEGQWNAVGRRTLLVELPPDYQPSPNTTRPASLIRSKDPALTQDRSRLARPRVCADARPGERGADRPRVLRPARRSVPDGQPASKPAGAARAADERILRERLAQPEDVRRRGVLGAGVLSGASCGSPASRRTRRGQTSPSSAPVRHAPFPGTGRAARSLPVRENGLLANRTCLRGTTQGRSDAAWCNQADRMRHPGARGGSQHPRRWRQGGAAATFIWPRGAVVPRGLTPRKPIMPIIQLSDLWAQLVAKATNEQKAEAAPFRPYIDALSRQIRRREMCEDPGAVQFEVPPYTDQPPTVYLSEADYAAQVAAGDPLAGGTTLIDPGTGIVLGLIDGNGVLQKGSAAAELETISADNTGEADCSPAVEAAVGPEGILVRNGGVRARFAKSGTYRLQEGVDVHPSISLEMDARGSILAVPGKDMPATRPDGAPASLFRVVRRTSDSSQNLAWAPTYSGFNLDFRGVHQNFPVHGIRVPDPDPATNEFDPDPTYSTNKDYSAGGFEWADVIGASGSGIVIEPGNGRFDVMSARALNCTMNGFELGGNDVVLSGHWGAGGCGQFAVKVGQAAGFLAVTGNCWGHPELRSLTCGAMFINRRMSFAVGFTVINDWVRLDGGDNFARGGVFGLNSMATHEENFLSDGVAAPDMTEGGPDPRLQAYFGVSDYKSSNFICNSFLRSTPTPFPGWMNIGGDLTGAYGTAFNWFVDASNEAQVNCIDTINSGPNVKPWSGNQANFTVSIGAPAVLSSTDHGLKDGHKVALTTTGALPTGLAAGIGYYVVASDADSFQLSLSPGGEAIETSGTQSGIHTWGNLSTLPYNARGGAQVNYLLMDSYQCETRIGARGPTHSRVLIGIADDEFGAVDSAGNRMYGVEIGDRTRPGGLPYRNAAYGAWELSNVVQYMDTAGDRRGIKSGATRVITPGQAFQFFSTASKGVDTFTIELPQRMNASQELDHFVFTGGGVASLTWMAMVADNSPHLPKKIDGYTVLRLLYSRDTDAWELLASAAAARPYVELEAVGEIATDCATWA